MNQVRETGTRARPRSDEPILEATEPPSEPSTTEGPEAANAPSVRYLSPQTTKVLLAVVLLASFAAEAWILYFVGDPATRMILGVIALLSVMWTSSYVSIIDRVLRALDARKGVRRYPKLRSRVSQMLDEIKRMHWLVVDMDRGFRNEETGRAEIEVIERRLAELVEGLPDVAGVEGRAPARRS